MPAAPEVCRPLPRRFAWLTSGSLIAALLFGGCEELGLEGPDMPPAPPKLAFAETAYDFGRVPQGTPVEHRFAFANDGDTALSIMNLRTACDCEATLIGGRDVAPHTGGAVLGRFDTDAVYGAQRRTITVYSNDPTQRAVLLTVTGEVLLDVAADPPQVYLGPVPPGVPLLREVALRTGSDAVRIGVPESDAPQLVLQLTDPSDGSAAVLAIGTARGAPGGQFSTVVRVPTTSVRHPVLHIPVSGVIAADAAAPPQPEAAPPPGGDGGGASTGAAPSGAAAP